MKPLSIIFVFVFSILCLSAQIPERPSSKKLYNNLSHEIPDFLNTDEANNLENKLEAFSRETSNQICVVIVDDLNGYTAAEFATMIGNEWKVGKQKFDNGIVLLVKPTGGKGNRDLFIAVGQGLEGAITDLATKKIRENIIQPAFAQGQFYEGLDKGTDALMQLAKGEISEKDLPSSGTGNSGLIVAIIILIIIITIFSKIKKTGYTSSGGGYWMGGTTYRGWNSGSSWSSGYSGGGWSGFGGGSFGGGGSGGKW